MPDTEEIMQRMELFQEALARPLFVWNMAYGRWNSLTVQGVDIHDPNLKGALTQLRNAAMEIDEVVRQYCRDTEALSDL